LVRKDERRGRRPTIDEGMRLGQRARDVHVGNISEVCEMLIRA
jgi:hypothetical protein